MSVMAATKGGVVLPQRVSLRSSMEPRVMDRPQQIGEIVMRVLSEDEAYLSRRLLYKGYYQELGWDVNAHPENASALVADHTTGELVDVYERDEEMRSYRQLVGCFDGDELIATIRLTRQHPTAGFDFSRYGITLPSALAGMRCVEVTRFYIAPNYRGTQVHARSWQFALEQGGRLGADMMVFTAPEELVSHYLTYRNVTPMPGHTHTFKYNSYEKNSCVFLMARPLLAKL
eukprot:TRINITY_DN10758_c0_g1_i3.p1 TRINITY_DN10758_c0_g1~~TRINITY_DN10758_c0_g1_i3.p1  ORF type:complete len:231 (+),score=75.83 TRINITY_DN10758_c0_g1_i3:271-963(+)